MKSYSNEIPNISTEELQKNIKTTEESNTLIMNNLEAIRLHDQKAAQAFKCVRRHQWINTGLLLLILLGAVGSTVYFHLFHPTMGG